jgi:hypothetical protein
MPVEAPVTTIDFIGSSFMSRRNGRARNVAGRGDRRILTAAALA